MTSNIVNKPLGITSHGMGSWGVVGGGQEAPY